MGAHNSSRMSEIHFFSLSWVSWDVPRTKSLELIRLIKCLSFSIEEKSNLTSITYKVYRIPFILWPIIYS